jgi:xylan 1,4-beta-xylosidase
MGIHGKRSISPLACSFAVWAALSVGAVTGVAAEAAAEVAVDFGRAAGVIRPLHGINKGPIAPGGLIDLTAPLRALHLPSARLHDCHWPNPDVVDIHAVFPNFDADPALASSYDFALTDEYLAAARRTGAEIIYRLGESIEHTTTKRFAHPPKDFEKWTAICLGIIRHYNEGWAGGARHNIRYWEIWNEPENRPAMWSGSDDDYFRLYRVAATAIKQRYPNLKVGGPAVGYSGHFVNGVFRPGAFVTNFLSYCRREALPLDFFSWHCYTADPVEITRRAHAIRRLLDDYGFTKTESHLNEWNFLPGHTWKPLSRSSAPEVRQRFYEEMSDAAGGAFIATTLIELQDSPVDAGNLFHGELGGFGLFNEFGVPQKNYHALRVDSLATGW